MRALINGLVIVAVGSLGWPSMAGSATGLATGKGGAEGRSAGRQGVVRVTKVEDGAEPPADKTQETPGSPSGDKATSGDVNPSATPGWLGVQLAPVSEPVATHLGLAQGSGLMVENIVTDSPAQRAGLQRWDVITQINGQTIDEDSPSFAETIRRSGPGAGVALTVNRGGQTTVVTAALAARPEEYAYMYESAPGRTLEQDRNDHALILRKDGRGGWHGLDLGDLNNWPNLDLDLDFEKLIPDLHGMSTHIYVDDGHTTFHGRVNRNGTVYEFDQENGGDIAVRKTDPNGTVTERTYADAEAMRQQDPEAYEVYEPLGKSAPSLAAPDASMGGPLQRDLRRKREDWEKRLDGQLNEWRRAFEDARQRGQWALPGGPGGVGAPPPMLDPNPNLDLWFRDHLAPGRRSANSNVEFRVEPDGKVVVTVRSRDSELTETFDNADQLRRERPDLYERFENLRSMQLEK